jgi:uncharacterized Zn finger protein
MLRTLADMAKNIIAQYIKPSEIKRLALPSNYRYGEAIFKRGGVEVIELHSAKVEAWVGGLDGTVAEGAGSRRRTTLSATSAGLLWHCAGNPKSHQIFCKHCVALALAILDMEGLEKW